MRKKKPDSEEIGIQNEADEKAFWDRFERNLKWLDEAKKAEKAQDENTNKKGE